MGYLFVDNFLDDSLVCGRIASPITPPSCLVLACLMHRKLVPYPNSAYVSFLHFATTRLDVPIMYETSSSSSAPTSGELPPLGNATKMLKSCFIRLKLTTGGFSSKDAYLMASYYFRASDERFHIARCSLYVANELETRTAWEPACSSICSDV